MILEVKKKQRDKFYEERQSQFKKDLKVEKDKKKENNWNLKSLIKENEGQNQTQQNNSQTENTNEENGDGTEYRGG